MSSSSAPWKQLLLSSINSNSHLKHSTYFQLVQIPAFLRLHSNFCCWISLFFLWFTFASCIRQLLDPMEDPQIELSSSGLLHPLSVKFTDFFIFIVCNLSSFFFVRGFQDGTDKIQINTDSRSCKVCNFGNWLFFVIKKM